MLRTSILTGTVHGIVDWVDLEKNEAGMFIYSQRATVRCVLLGDAVKQQLHSNALQKGSVVTAFGEFNARCRKRNKEDTEAEVICLAAGLLIEPSKGIRIRGSLHCTLKGVVMFWDNQAQIVKTFFNAGTREREVNFTGSVYLAEWLRGFDNGEKRDRFVQMLQKGREFTSAVRIETGAYTTREGVRQAVLHLLPLDFQLQS